MKKILFFFCLFFSMVVSAQVVFLGGNTVNFDSIPYDNTISGLVADDLKEAVDELAFQNISFSGIDHLGDFTMLDSHIGKIHNIIVNAPDSIVVSWPNTLTEFGFTKFVVKGTGFVAFDMDAMTTTGGSFKTQSGRGESATVRNYSATEADVLQSSQLLTYTPVAGETLGPELWTTASAGNGNNNADTTTGYQALSSSSLDMASVSDGSGGFIIQASAVDGNLDYIRMTAFTASLTDGVTYKMTVRARYTVLNAGQASISLWDGLDAPITPVVLTNTLTSYDIYFTINSANGLFYPKFYMVDSNTGTAGNQIQVIVDSIEEVL